MAHLGSFTFLFMVALVSPVASGIANGKFDGSSLDRSVLHDYVDHVSGETVGDEFEIDITGDEKAEQLIGVTCGNGGCEYYIFENRGDLKYAFSGTAFLQKGGFEVLKTMHNGFYDIIGYSYMSANTGTLFREEYDGKNYVIKASFGVDVDFFNLLRPTR